MDERQLRSMADRQGIAMGVLERDYALTRLYQEFPDFQDLVLWHSKAELR